ncbi:bifunctional (p)ppGpp synthetase/guanosine-3',5'-bis(diphosphate) 3'-pyrophosphohydrolase [Cellulosimicrobium terreum]|uniref:Bifunctional (P)ppGpp synthetase/guanosine-3',5'-bis(Diphosphate) 3'-pyrophosphohydrolase n=1 Tax=Cellulosimicrobium funkei TaxID=264251 RepID=A0A4Y8QY26_9MICO|nr:bifunctional (p)ppGpp synthetase/guanosine-3',5'-bis(diphosphate) 3'-pyrophosphohydrolase [Cellulosimicrobium funkei]TGA67996.1 bifunctional (p)ppGpp synthetase/guanosine-3',5'-bis(diphosphate) 3'-pyrophosphohydrolase [Cellulosimicrobium terreum]
MIGTARRIAERAHGLQVDKAGHPYIDHPRRVAERLERGGAPVAAIVAGWLHDVLEDTTLTAVDLRAAGIPEDAIAAVEAVTKREGESPADYAERIAATPLAADVKYADLADNTDPTRVEQLDGATRERLEAKYALFRDVLARALDRSQLRRDPGENDPDADSSESEPLNGARATRRAPLRST